MPSFRTTASPKRVAAARFVGKARRELLKALEEERAKSGTRQAHIAKALDVHRSVISRELRGLKDISLGRIGEIAWALGRDPVIELREHDKSVGDNKPAVVSGATLTTTPVSDRIAGAWAGNATTASSASLYEVQE